MVFLKHEWKKLMNIWNPRQDLTRRTLGEMQGWDVLISGTLHEGGIFSPQLGERGFLKDGQVLHEPLYVWSLQILHEGYSPSDRLNYAKIRKYALHRI